MAAEEEQLRLAKALVDLRLENTALTEQAAAAASRAQAKVLAAEHAALDAEQRAKV